MYYNISLIIELIVFSSIYFDCWIIVYNGMQFILVHIYMQLLRSTGNVTVSGLRLVMMLHHNIAIAKRRGPCVRLEIGRFASGWWAAPNLWMDDYY